MADLEKTKKSRNDENGTFSSRVNSIPIVIHGAFFAHISSFCGLMWTLTQSSVDMVFKLYIGAIYVTIYDREADGERISCL